MYLAEWSKYGMVHRRIRPVEYYQNELRKKNPIFFGIRYPHNISEGSARDLKGRYNSNVHTYKIDDFPLIMF